MSLLMAGRHQNEAGLRDWLRHRLSNSVDVDDTLQEVFIEAMRQGESFSPFGNVSELETRSDSPRSVGTEATACGQVRMGAD